MNSLSLCQLDAGRLAEGKGHETTDTCMINIIIVNTYSYSYHQ